jgi:hypothetical protein
MRHLRYPMLLLESCRPVTSPQDLLALLVVAYLPCLLLQPTC